MIHFYLFIYMCLVEFPTDFSIGLVVLPSLDSNLSAVGKSVVRYFEDSSRGWEC